MGKLNCLSKETFVFESVYPKLVWFVVALVLTWFELQKFLQKTHKRTRKMLKAITDVITIREITWFETWLKI